MLNGKKLLGLHFSQQVGLHLIVGMKKTLGLYIRPGLSSRCKHIYLKFYNILPSGGFGGSADSDILEGFS